MATAFPKEADLRAVRHFGFENELGVQEHLRYGSEVGLEEDKAKDLLKLGVMLSSGHDGGGREFRTKPVNVNALLRQKRVHQKVCRYWDVLKENTQVKTSGGTHIHVSILNKDHVNMERNATAIATAFHSQFQKVCGRSTHWAPRRNYQNVEQIAEVMEESKIANRGRSYWMKGGMLSPTQHGTLEFRGPKGSNDKEEMLAWAEFLENVVKAANRKSAHGLQFKDLIKTPRVAAYVEAMQGTRKLSKTDLEKTLDENHLR